MPKKSLLTPLKRLWLFEQLMTVYPMATTELVYTNPFTFLVAVVLSARMTDKGVNKATAALFEHVETPQDMVNLGEEGLRKYIQSIGLYKTKAKHIIALSHLLIEKYNSTVPADRKALESLPGVGRKSANVILCVIFNQATFPVDTHVARVSTRTGLVGPSFTQTPRRIEEALESVVPKAYRHQAHHLLVLHGRYTCTSQRPKCIICPIADVCYWLHQHPIAPLMPHQTKRAS